MKRLKYRIALAEKYGFPFGGYVIEKRFLYFFYRLWTKHGSWEQAKIAYEHFYQKIVE